MNTFNTKGKLLIDKIGQSYLGLDIDKEHHLLFQTIMNHLNLHSQLQKKLTRDNNEYHITLVNSMEYSHLKKENPEKLKNIENEIINKSFEFKSNGIGKISKNNDNTYFYVVTNDSLNNLLTTYEIKNKNFHITLGFDTKDLHHIPKTINTVFFSEEQINKISSIKKNKL